MTSTGAHGYGRGGAMRMRDKREAADAIARNRGSFVVKHTNAGHNRSLAVTGAGETLCILHRTAIVIRDAAGMFLITDGGWATMTTRSAIGGFMAGFGYWLGAYGDGKGGTVLTTSREGDNKVASFASGDTVRISPADLTVRVPRT